jgi:formate hydrogenlyase transcriptional activator
MSVPSQLEPSLHVQWEDRLRFETFISNLSARFVRLPSGKVHQEIERALQEVTEFFHAHRCGILEVYGDEKVARLIHAWYADGVRRVPAGKNCAEGFSWTFDTLVDKKQAVAFNHLSELPPDAAPDLPAYKQMGASSCFMIPLFTGEEVRHIVVLQTMEAMENGTALSGAALSTEYIPRLRLMGEVLVNALGRKKGRRCIERERNASEPRGGLCSSRTVDT